ncbi:MAG: T9SS type A sorting domain-containing protein [Fidelibacterota bacterium]
MNKYFTLIFTLGNLSLSLLFSQDEGGALPINLAAYGGTESILLIWDIPSDNEIEEIQLFRSSELTSSYDMIDLDEMVRDRYLDRDVITGVLLFYRVEIQMADGARYSSSIKTPALARSFDLLEYERIMESVVTEYPQTISLKDEIIDIHSFNSSLLQDYFAIQSPIDIENLQMLNLFLLTEKVNFSSFINVFGLKGLTQIEPLFNGFEIELMENYLNVSFQQLEPIYRQNLLLSPEEWNQEKANLLTVITTKLASGKDIIRQDKNFIESLSAIKMTGLIRDNESFRIHLTQLFETISHVQLMNGDEMIEVHLNEYSDMVVIPDTWNHVELWLNDDLIQSIPTIYENGSMTISLDDQYYFKDKATTAQVVKSIPDQEFELNELMFNSFDKKINIEIAGQSNDFTVLGVFLNDSLLFEWEPNPTFQILYYDSSAILPENAQFGWLHLCQFENENWEIIESRPLNLNKPFHEGKIPDRESWSDLSFKTFGRANDLTKSSQAVNLIPEIFALYQNYPNPFNSSTKITFDLLEASIVNVFVSDARGRKIEVFLDEVFLVNGTYSFTWSGEFQSSGIYFVTVEAQSGDYLPFVMSRKMIYLK